jgi:hypothetical protein
MNDAGKQASSFMSKTAKKMPASGKGNPEAGLRLAAFLKRWVWRDMNARQTHFIRPMPGGFCWGFRDGPTQACHIDYATPSWMSIREKPLVYIGKTP